MNEILCTIIGIKTTDRKFNVFFHFLLYFIFLPDSTILMLSLVSMLITAGCSPIAFCISKTRPLFDGWIQSPIKYKFYCGE